MDENVEVKEQPVKIALFKSLLNVAFNLIKWKVLGSPQMLVIAKEYNLISMYVNPKTQMFSLKLPKGSSVMSMDATDVDAITISKGKVNIIGSFDKKKGDINGRKTDKKSNISIS